MTPIRCKDWGDRGKMLPGGLGVWGSFGRSLQHRTGPRHLVGSAPIGVEGVLGNGSERYLNHWMLFANDVAFSQNTTKGNPCGKSAIPRSDGVPANTCDT